MRADLKQSITVMLPVHAREQSVFHRPVVAVPQRVHLGIRTQVKTHRSHHGAFEALQTEQRQRDDARRRDSGSVDHHADIGGFGGGNASIDRAGG